MAATDPVRVVVIDDSVDVRLVLRIRATSWPVDIVGEADDAVRGVELVARLCPDVIILDNELPTGTGIEAIPRLRRAAPGVRLVMFTNYGDTGPLALDAGADGWLDKLSPWDDLFALVVALGRRSQEPV